MNKQRRSQGGTSPETTPQTGSGVAHFSVSEVVQFSMSVDKGMRFGARGSVAARLVLICWAHLPMLCAVTPSEG